MDVDGGAQEHPSKPWGASTVRREPGCSHCSASAARCWGRRFRCSRDGQLNYSGCRSGPLRLLGSFDQPWLVWGRPSVGLVAALAFALWVILNSPILHVSHDRIRVQRHGEVVRVIERAKVHAVYHTVPNSSSKPAPVASSSRTRSSATRRSSGTPSSTTATRGKAPAANYPSGTSTWTSPTASAHHGPAIGHLGHLRSSAWSITRSAPERLAAERQMRTRRRRSVRRPGGRHSATTGLLTIHACLPTCRILVKPRSSNSSTVPLNRNRSCASRPKVISETASTRPPPAAAICRRAP